MWRDFSLSSAALVKIELVVGKCANEFRAFLFHSIRSSSSRRLSPFGRWRETRTALSRLARSPKMNSVR
jgi:hypothetical protein